MQGKLQDGSVIICGILPRDAEYKTVGGKGSSLTTFSVKAGEREPQHEGENGEAIWVNCKCWHAVARSARSLKKGDSVLCVGRIENYYSQQTEKEYVNLVCEFIVPMREEITIRTDAYEPKNNTQDIPNGYEDYSDMFGDDGVPF